MKSFAIVFILAGKILFLVCFSIVFLVVSAPPSWAFSGFEVETVASGLSIPTAISFAPSGRIFVAQKGGTVRVIKNGILSSTPVITLTDINTYGDRGLIGIAVDPNFANNGYLYLSYTYENSPGTNTAGPKTGRIVRVTVVGDVALESSKVVLLGTVGGTLATPSCENYLVTADCIPSDDASHSVGGLGFGHDGRLYATIGDGASFDYADTRSLRAQNLDSLSGKVIRINPDGTAPTDNPFYNGDPTANRSKIWALGARNMFRFSFQPGTDNLFGGDVGWSTWEEINIVKPGVNLGWPCYEGVDITAKGLGCSIANPTPPWYYYHHNAAGAGSVTAGDFLSSVFPSEYQGAYVYGDYVQNTMKIIQLDVNNAIISQNDLITNPGGPVDIKTGSDGYLYYVAIYTGEIKRIIFTEGNSKPTAVLSSDMVGGVLPLTVVFSGSGSSDPDNDILSYEWDFGDGASGTGRTTSHTYISDGTYDAILTVRNGSGGIDTKGMKIYAGNQKPSVTILSPVNGSTYHSGDTIHLSGTGSDPETGIISGSGFHWQILLHHNTHIHYLQETTGYETSFVAPDHSSTDIYIEIILTVSDPTGFSSSKSINMYLNNSPTATGNLIKNPGMEESTGPSDTPNNWIKGWFGNNSQIWTYPVEGEMSQKAAKVEITQYGSGDAKWAFDPVSVQENTKYTFSDSYQSNIASDISVDFGYADGTHTYSIIGTLVPSSTWQSYTQAFMTPIGAKTVSVYHRIMSTGWLSTDNYTLIRDIIQFPPPIARNDEVSGKSDTTITIPDILANDQAFGSGNSLYSSTIDINTLIAGVQTSVTLPEGTLTVSPSSSIATFTPTIGFSGKVTIPYTVQDSIGQKAQASIIITLSKDATESSQVLFANGFEDGTFNAWDNNRGSNFFMSLGTCRLGPDTNNNSVKITGENQGGSQVLQKSVSTLGYENLHLSFCYKWDSLEAGEGVVIEYTTDGSTWKPIKTIGNSLAVHMFYAADDTEIATSNGPGVIPTPIFTTPETLASHSISLPADARNSPLFSLRLRENMGDSNDFVWIDDIQLIGLPIADTTTHSNGTGATGTGMTNTGTTGTGLSNTIGVVSTTRTIMSSLPVIGSTSGGGSDGGGSLSFASSIVPVFANISTSTGIGTSTTSGMLIVATDLLTHPFRVAIEKLIRAGVMNNVPRVYPNRSISRGEFMKLLSIANGYITPVKVSKKFGDISKSSSLIKYVDYGISKGWVNTKNINFRPNDIITQGEIDKLIGTIKKTATADTIAKLSGGVSRGKAASDIVSAFYTP